MEVWVGVRVCVCVCKGKSGPITSKSTDVLAECQ